MPIVKNKFKSYLSLLGITQEKASQLLYVSLSTIRRYLNGHEPTKAFVQRSAGLFHCKEHDIYRLKLA